MARSRDLERLLPIEMLATRFEVNRVIPVVVVGVRGVVEVGRQADVHAAERVDHVAEGDKVDCDVAVERQPCDLPHLVLGRVAAAVAPLVLRRDAADDGHVGNLVGRVDLVDPDAVGVALKVQAEREVARD